MVWKGSCVLSLVCELGEIWHLIWESKWNSGMINVSWDHDLLNPCGHVFQQIKFHGNQILCTLRNRVHFLCDLQSSANLWFLSHQWNIIYEKIKPVWFCYVNISAEIYNIYLFQSLCLVFYKSLLNVDTSSLSFKFSVGIVFEVNTHYSQATPLLLPAQWMMS